MIGEALRLIRTIKGYKAKEIAEKLGISPSYLSQIETGQKKPPLELIENFAAVVGERPSSILFFYEEYTQSKDNPISTLTRPTIMRMLRAIANDSSSNKQNIKSTN